MLKLFFLLSSVDLSYCGLSVCPFSSDLSNLTMCFLHRAAAHWVVFVSGSFYIIIIKTLETVVCEIQKISTFRKTETSSSDTNYHVTAEARDPYLQGFMHCTAD